MAMRRRLDFVVLCETHLYDATTVRALADRVAPGMHLRILASCRPKPDQVNGSGKLAPASGGILVLVFNPKLVLIDSTDDNRGMLSFSASLPGAAPFACICVYYPDASSPYARWTDSLIEASRLEFLRRRAVFGNNIFWLGDFNIRFGCYRLWRRVSVDNTPPTLRARVLRRLMRSLGVLPMHGRAAHIPSQFTSRQVAGLVGMAEVDYIVAPLAIPPTAFRPIPAPSWGSSELPRGTHIPLLVEVDLPAAPVKVERPHLRARRPFVLPPYCDPSWFAIHDRIKCDLPHALRQASNPNVSLEACHKSLVELFRSAAIAVCGTDIPRVRTFKQRLYKGAPLPSEIVAMFDLARYYRKRRKHSAGERARVFWGNAADEAKKSATRMADTFLMRFRDTLLSNLQHLMRIDPHQTHSYLAHLRGAELANCAEPSSIPADPEGRPPLLRFGAACKRIVTQVSACPTAVTLHYWLGMISHAQGGNELMREFTAKQIYPYLFPATQRHYPKPCHRNCRVCRQYIAEVKRWRPRDPFPVLPAPHHRGCLHTSRGADLDNLVAELIRWVRPSDWRERYDYRMAVCEVLARFFNRMLSSGIVPEGSFTRCVTSPLFKAVKPGTQPPPRWDDDGYRFITNSSTLAKAFSTLLASRLSHWAVRTGLLSENQVAFLPFRGTEEHVFSLQQVLRARARSGLKTYALFVDFKKAYDSVHQQALWTVLEHKGVPPQFIDLLRDWAAKRRTQVRVNGELSESFPMMKGVPQGDPLSCLLFNLFIDSLSRFLSSRPDIPGVSAFNGGIVLQHLLYADDLVCLAGSADELQRMLDYVKQWADAWGLELNTSVGKTEAMLIDADAAFEPAQQPPLVLNDGRNVRWTQSYRYLGYMLRCDLRDNDAVAGMLKHLDYLWQTHFIRNGVVRHASAAFQMQFYCTMVQGSLRNLRALTSLYADDVEKLETTLRRHLGTIFNMRGLAPIELVSGVGAVLPWRAVHAQEHERLYLQLSNSIYPESVAAQVFRLAQTDHRLGASFAKRNWVRDWEQKRAVLIAAGVPVAPADLDYERIAPTAKVFGRAAAFHEWQRVGRDRVPNAPSCDAASPPPNRPLEAVANLYENYRAPIASLGSHHDFTPFSAHGPLCSGSIPSRSNIAASRLGPIIWARTGAAVMQSPLFAGFCADGDFAANERPCPLCGISPVDVFHFATECNNHLIARWRQEVEHSARGLVADLTEVMACERDRAGRLTGAEYFLLRRIRRAITCVAFDTPEGDFIIYRLLLAQPWAERVSSPGMRAVRLLGRAFDLPGVYHRFERPLLDVWCRWSNAWLWRLSRAWHMAHAAL